MGRGDLPPRVAQSWEAAQQPPHAPFPVPAATGSSPQTARGFGWKERARSGGPAAGPPLTPSHGSPGSAPTPAPRPRELDLVCINALCSVPLRAAAPFPLPAAYKYVRTCTPPVNNHRRPPPACPVGNQGWGTARTLRALGSPPWLPLVTIGEVTQGGGQGAGVIAGVRPTSAPPHP